VVTLLRNAIEVFLKPGFLKNYVISYNWEKKYYSVDLDGDPTYFQLAAASGIPWRL
jgi:hypothetical protein